MITIELVRVRCSITGQIVLVGRRYQDRWNLSAIGIESIPADRNQAAIKKLRRCYPEFAFKVIRAQTTVPMTREDNAMLGNVQIPYDVYGLTIAA